MAPMGTTPPSPWRSLSPSKGTSPASRRRCAPQSPVTMEIFKPLKGDFTRLPEKVRPPGPRRHAVESSCRAPPCKAFRV
eukprot:5519089-Pyramimonas_sp.AAC.1